MPTLIYKNGVPEEIDLLQILPPMEGELNMYYGKIRNGKNYTATVDILKKLKQGAVIYANWEIDVKDYDERKNLWKLFLGLIGIKKNFYIFPKENFHFTNFNEVKPDFLTWLATINDCELYVDEAYIYFDSYKLTKLDLDERITVLSTGHFNRTINVLSQRPSGIHVTLRGNINRFFKIEKISNGLWFIPARFQKTEIQDMTNEMPDETRDIDGNYIHAESIKKYWGTKKIYNAYNTQYLRGNMETSQPNYAVIHYKEQEDVAKQIWENFKIFLLKIQFNFKRIFKIFLLKIQFNFKRIFKRKPKVKIRIDETPNENSNNI